MKQKEVFNKIGGIIQELSDQYEYLQTVQDDLNDLELELFVSNAHFLTDHIEILCKLNLQKSNVRRPFIEKLESTREHKFFEPVVQQLKPGSNLPDVKSLKASPITPKIEPAKTPIPEEKPVPAINITAEENPAPQLDLGLNTPSDSYSFIREEPETIRHEITLNRAIDLDDIEPDVPEHEAVKTNKTAIAEEIKAEEEAVVTPVIEENKIEEPKAEEITPATEVVKEEQPAAITEPVKPAEDDVLTINQKMSSQLGDKAATKTEQLAIKPISDIKLAITLNDKLLYVKDLFNGYNLAYSEAIEILNRFSTFEEASRFLKTNYVTKNNWESKPATTEKFYALLKRRYA